MKRAFFAFRTYQMLFWKSKYFVSTISLKILIILPCSVGSIEEGAGGRGRVLTGSGDSYALESSDNEARPYAVVIVGD